MNKEEPLVHEDQFPFKKELIDKSRINNVFISTGYFKIRKLDLYV